MKVFFIFLFALFLLQVSFAQIDTLKQKKIDSLTIRLKKDSTHIYRFQIVRPYLNIDNRNSVINKVPVSFKGIQIGIILHETNAMGLGFYAINQSSKKPYATKDGTVSAKKSLSMNYMTIFYIHSFIEKKYFELNVPVEIGLGGFKISYADSLSGKIYKQVSGGIIPIGIGLQAIFKPTKWVGISLLVGYRAVAEKSVNQNFNGAYSSVGLSFDIRQIIRDIRYKGVKRKHYRRQVKALLKP